MSTALPARASLDFGQGLRFVFDDPQWVKKVLLGGLFTLLATMVVGIPFVVGYWMRLTRNVAAGAAQPLPEWSDLGGLFSEGMQGALVALVYFAVVFVLPAGAIVAVMIAMGAMASTAGRSGEAIAQAFGMVGIFGFYAVLFVAMIAMYVFVPVALTRVALTGRMGAGFELRACWEFVRANFANYALALVLYMVASFVSQFGMILCCIGIFPAAFWAYCLLGWGMGETVRLAGGFPLLTT